MSVSSGDLESSADSGVLDMEEKYYKFDTMRQRAEFTYKEIRRCAVEATRTMGEHDNFMRHAKFRYGPRSQWAREKVEEEARLAKRGAMASARLQRRFSKLKRVIPMARRKLDFDREDGGDDRVPTDEEQLLRHELKRIFPQVYDENNQRRPEFELEAQDLPVANSTPSPTHEQRQIPVSNSTPRPLNLVNRTPDLDYYGRAL